MMDVSKIREQIVAVYPKDVEKSEAKLYPPLAELEDMGFVADKLLAIPVRYKNKFVLLVNLLKDVLDQGDGGRRLDIHGDLWGEFKRLVQCLVHLTNSASFREGHAYFDFDKVEMDKKLGRR